MRSKFVGPNAVLIANADSNDFIGSTRVVVPLSVDEIATIPLPKKFGWNTLVVQPPATGVRVMATISSMQDIRDGNAVWIDLENTGGLLNQADDFAGGTVNVPIMFAWEHPISAFGFTGDADSEVRVEICSKHD